MVSPTPVSTGRLFNALTRETRTIEPKEEPSSLRSESVPSSRLHVIKQTLPTKGLVTGSADTIASAQQLASKLPMVTNGERFIVGVI